jgi:hypothetical protein
VHEDVAQRAILRASPASFFFSPGVDAAVLEQHDLPRRDLDAVDPVRAQRDLTAEQLAQPLRHRRQRIRGLEAPSVGRPRCDVTITAAPASSAMRMQGTEGADARVLGDLAGVVLRHVQVGADEDALAGHAALGNEVGKAKDVHGGILEVTSRSPGAGSAALRCR